MTRALLQQALDAMETCVTIKHGGALSPEQLFNVPAIESTRKAIRTHLAQPQGEPADYQICLSTGRWTHCAKHLYDAAIANGMAENFRALYLHPAHTEEQVQQIVGRSLSEIPGSFESTVRRILGVPPQEDK